MRSKSLIVVVITIILLILGIWLMMRGEKVEAPSEPVVTPDPVTGVATTSLPAGWKYVPVTFQDIDYAYPDPFQGKYVKPTEWPPRVELVAHEYSCISELPPATDGPYGEVQKKTIDGTEYCVSTTAEGAAGSTFTTYEYRTEQGHFLTRVFFTLKTVQCANYDEPERSECLKEQKDFDVDGMAHTISESVRMQ